MTEKFTERAQRALNNALTAATEFGHTYIGTEHLLIGLMREEECAAAKLLTSRGIILQDVKDAVTDYAGVGLPALPTPSDMTPRTKKILESAYASARQTPVGYIGTEHLLYAILEEKDCVACRLLLSLGANTNELKNDILSVLGGGKRPETKAKQTSSTASKIPEGFGKNLTDAAVAAYFDPVIGREEETERLIRILSRRTKNNPCLLGEPGVGKTAIVEGLAARIARGDVPDLLKGKSIFSLDISSMIAGAKYRGEFEERLRGLLEQLLKNRSVILFIDEIHTIVGAGAAEGAVDAANILKPLLARGEIQLIGATTLKEYRRFIEKDAALERRFQPIMVEEPNEEDALHILFGLRERYELHHGVKISDEAIRAAVSLSKRYISDRFLPDKAIDLIDEAAARLTITLSEPSPEVAKIENELAELECQKENAILSQKFEYAAELRDEILIKRNALHASRQKKEERLPLLTAHDIAKVVTAWSGIPTGALTEEEGMRLRNLEARLNQRVIGQTEAVSAVVNAIRRNRTGVRDPAAPIGSFLFAGPTGVGKTALSKALSLELYGKEEALIRLDMSEYHEGFSTSKIIGSPPGYVGYDDGGQLTERVRRHPYSVILFDEIEKAHEDVYHLLLQILDDGIITDAQGRTVSFRNTIIILTSNLGAEHFNKKNALGFSDGNDTTPSNTNHTILSDIEKHFRPEFINRLDEIVIFHPLDFSACRMIVKSMTDESIKRIRNLGIRVEITEEALTYLVQHGYNSKYGARPLKRLIATQIECPISDMLLDENLSKNIAISITVENEKLVFKKE